MKLLIVMSLTLFSVGAVAQDDSGSYIGFGLGQLDYEQDVYGTTLKDNALGYKAYGGYRFDQTWAIEASYGQTDDLEWFASVDIPGFAPVSARLAADYDILEVRGLAHVNWFLIGLGYWDADLSVSISEISTLIDPFSVSTSDSDSGASLILGGEWDLRRWSVRAEFDYFDTEDTIDAYTLGMGIHFRF